MYKKLARQNILNSRIPFIKVIIKFCFPTHSGTVEYETYFDDSLKVSWSTYTLKSTRTLLIHPVERNVMTYLMKVKISEPVLKSVKFKMVELSCDSLFRVLLYVIEDILNNLTCSVM